MMLMDALAEARIREAQQRGELEGLPGAGEPLLLDDLSLVPENLRPAWLLLRNSGYLPPELERLKERVALEGLLAQLPSDDERSPQLMRRLHRLALECDIAIERWHPSYRQALENKLSNKIKQIKNIQLNQ